MDFGKTLNTGLTIGIIGLGLYAVYQVKQKGLIGATGSFLDVLFGSKENETGTAPAISPTNISQNQGSFLEKFGYNADGTIAKSPTLKTNTPTLFTEDYSWAMSIPTTAKTATLKSSNAIVTTQPTLNNTSIVSTGTSKSLVPPQTITTARTTKSGLTTFQTNYPSGYNTTPTAVTGKTAKGDVIKTVTLSSGGTYSYNARTGVQI